MKFTFSKRDFTYYALLVWEFVQATWKFLFSQRRKSIYTGRFMSKREQMEVLSPNNDGAVINGILRLDLKRSFTHILLTGATGAGKSSTIYTPTLLACEYPMIILDISGALYDVNSGDLRKRGFKVLRINFSSPSESEGYNVLHRANTHSKIKQVAATLIETSLGKGQGGDGFWNAMSRQLLYVLIQVLKEATEEKYHNLANVRHLLNNLSANKESATYKWVIENASDELFTEFIGSMSGGEKVTNSVLANTRAALELISDPELAKMTATDTIGDLQGIRHRKTALFLTVNETDITYLSYLIALVIQDLFDMAMVMPGKKDLPLLILLDEFGHFKIKGFSSILTTLRKRQVGCVISIQSKSMLRHQYGAVDAESILTGGVATHMILPGQANPKDNRELSELLGSTTVERRGQQIKRPILTPDEIYSLRGKGIFLHSGYRPALLKLRPFYKNPTLLARTKVEPVSYKKRALPPVELIHLEV